MWRMLSRQVCFAFLICLGIGLATEAMAIEPSAPSKLISRSDAVGMRISSMLGAKFRTATEFHKEDHGSLVSYYSENGYAPVWVGENGLNDRALRVIKEIKHADDWGLRVSDYDLPSSRISSSQSGVPIDELAETELTMSFAVLAYARHASGGRLVPTRLSKNLDYTPPYADAVMVMTMMAKGNNLEGYLSSLHPRHEQFLKLKAMLAEAREQKEAVEEVVIIPAGPTLRPGDVHERVALVRKRLKAEASDEEQAELYDEELVKVVRAFQKSKGLGADAMIGMQTLRAMNGGQETQGDRKNKILANMERWRWLTRDMGDFHVRINIPEYKMRIVKDENIIFEERIVAGKVTNSTPAFSDEMERVVFNPSWYPPRSIIMNEIIPSAQNNYDAIRRQGLEVRDARGQIVDPYYVDWDSAEARRYSFRQPPGRRNALGVVKFLFPNKHSVYMHDTPSKSLFNKEVRAYSHGCMRVRNPRDVAEVLLKEDQGWSRKRIDSVIAAGANRPVELKRKIPVHVTYFTLWTDKDGNAQTFRDIYKHDARILAAFDGRMPPPEPVAAVASARRLKRRHQQSTSIFGGFFN